VVFIIGTEEDNFINGRALTDVEIEEEFRLRYVAMKWATVRLT
jgi:superfamily I DNA/RNA helicase